MGDTTTDTKALMRADELMRLRDQLDPVDPWRQVLADGEDELRRLAAEVERLRGAVVLDVGGLLMQAHEAVRAINAAPVAQPVPWPTTAEQVRAFVGSHCASATRAEGEADDVYTLTAHDLLSAFDDWSAAPVAQPLTDAEAADCGLLSELAGGDAGHDR